MMAIVLIKEACIAGARKREACALLGVTVRTVERWEQRDGTYDKRKQAKRSVGNKLTPGERDAVLTTANSHQYRDLSPCKIVPMLADEGRYLASESTFYRVLRDAEQLTHRQLSRPVKHQRPEAYEAHAANQVWSWDISYLPTQVRGLYVYLYLIMDIYSRKIVGWSVHELESSAYAAQLIQQACLDENVQQEQLVLHADNGSPMKGATMLAMLEKLGVVPSFSRPSVSDDNPYSEALFKTLKYHPSFPMLTKFATIGDARRWCEQFVGWYNADHLHSALKFVTPLQRHTGDDKAILRRRHVVYEAAKRLHPERWAGATRNWTPTDVATLNPNRKLEASKMKNKNPLKQVS